MRGLVSLTALMLALALVPALAAEDKPATPPIQNVSGADGPTLAVGMKRAAAGGWDLSLGVTNFRFAASATATAPVAGEGRAMVAIDGKKPAPVTSASYHLDALPAGIHQVDVGLYGDDGRLYTGNGHPVAERIFLRVGKTKPAADAPADPTTVDFTVAANKVTNTTGGTLNSGTIRFKQGDLVRLRWTTDEAMELHLHGYDVLAEVVAGEPTSMVFDADLAGRFTAEKHGGKEVNLVYVEVYPK